MNNADNLSSIRALCALADGEADSAMAASVTAAWRDDADLRERWHLYHLIGDTLRSEDLADGRHDAAFLQRLRSRLQEEPVVLAPPVAAERASLGVRSRPGAMGAPRWRRWAPPAAVAAGFMAVAGVLTVTRMPVAVDAEPGAQLARSAPAPVAPAQSLLVGPVAVVDSGSDRDESTTGGVLIRDARLDQYLTAHKQFGGSSALGMPAGFLRSATFERPSAAPGSR